MFLATAACSVYFCGMLLIESIWLLWGLMLAASCHSCFNSRTLSEHLCQVGGLEEYVHSKIKDKNLCLLYWSPERLCPFQAEDGMFEYGCYLILGSASTWRGMPLHHRTLSNSLAGITGVVLEAIGEAASSTKMPLQNSMR